MSIGLPEILVILLIIFLLFGAKRLPDLARSLGKSLKEFKKGVKDAGDMSEIDEQKTEDKK
ncbi:MAG: preprotein translocase [Spirochaetes bacterium GWF1_51_8]|nr:MAG: preprotein translocase [Spirochaetes bacterium GWF1_51_8]